MFLQSYLVGIFVTLVSWYGMYSWRRRRLYRLASKIPGPNGVPFFGEAFSVIGTNQKQAFRALINLAKDHATPTKIWFGPYCAIIIDDPQDLQIVLNSQKCLDKSIVYNLIGLEKGLVINGGNMWKIHRKLLDPSFGTPLLQSFVPVFNRKSKILIRELEKQAGKPEFDIFTQISANTLETLLVTMMGLEKDIQTDAYNNEYLHSVEKGTKILNDRVFKIHLHFEPFFRMSKTYSLYQKFVTNGIFKIAHDVLEAKRENAKNSKTLPATKHKIFVDQLLSANLSKEEIEDEINTVIGAGHETSSLIISAALVMLAMHKDIQIKAFEEVQEMTKLFGDEVTENHLHNLQYLDRVIKETLRLFPVLPITARTANEDVKLETCTIPAGSNIVISIFNAHRKVENWGEDAASFKPDRFLPENFKKIHPYSFIPFTKGLRNCIGWRYSMMFMKTTLFHLLKNFEFNTTLNYKELDYEIALTMTLAQRYKVMLQRREVN